MHVKDVMQDVVISTEYFKKEPRLLEARSIPETPMLFWPRITVFPLLSTLQVEKEVLGSQAFHPNSREIWVLRRKLLQLHNTLNQNKLAPLV